MHHHTMAINTKYKLHEIPSIAYSVMTENRTNSDDDDEVYKGTSLKEIKRAISRLKSGKATAPDSFPAYLFIQAGDNMISALHTLFSLA